MTQRLQLKPELRVDIDQNDLSGILLKRRIEPSKNLAHDLRAEWIEEINYQFSRWEVIVRSVNKPAIDPGSLGCGVPVSAHILYRLVMQIHAHFDTYDLAKRKFRCDQ